MQMNKRVDGVVLLDKPTGMSSQQAVTAVKHVFHADKAGHTGTLDPLATGLLPICLGEATKYSQDLLDADKAYIARLRFGITTDTGDAEGTVIAEQSTDSLEASKAKLAIEAILTQFTGAISQTPPMYSALKRDGKPLYEYARAGIELEREVRNITIHSIRILEVQWPEAMIEVVCSKGTYIRVLAEDMGKTLGFGAHLVGLRRTMVGHLQLKNSITLDALKESADVNQLLLPVDALLQTLTPLTVDEQQAKRLEMGQRVPCVISNESALKNLIFRIYRSNPIPQNFIGTADWRAGVLHPRRFISQRLIHSVS